MQMIVFTARVVREKLPYSTEDVNTYEVRYIPPRRSIHGTMGSNFSSLLVEAVSGLPEYNKRKEAVSVSFEGDFPGKCISEARALFEMYEKAEDVQVIVTEKFPVQAGISRQ